MDEEQHKHIEELATWKKEAKAAQDKVSVLCLYSKPFCLFVKLNSRSIDRIQG